VRSLLTFFSLTFAVSWICFTAAAAISGGSLELRALSGPIFYVGVFAPSLVALALTARADGREGMLALLRRIGRWPEGARWYVFAVGYMAAIKLTVALLHRLATGVWPPFGQEAAYIMAAAIVVSTPVQAGEEIGWRGYALPRLARHLGLARASVVLGLIWACWHLPFFFIPGGDKSGQSFPAYLAGATALSVAMAWLYWRTNGSLLLTMLMHAAVNNTTNIVPSAGPAGANPFALRASLVAWLTVALLWICALYFLVQMRSAELEHGPQAATDLDDVASPESVQQL
jgi:uncharacterized protein